MSMWIFERQIFPQHLVKDVDQIGFALIIIYRRVEHNFSSFKTPQKIDP